MSADFLPFRVLLLAVSGWVHREQQEVIDYLVEENRVLREQIGNRRLRLTDQQRRLSLSKTSGPIIGELATAQSLL